MRREHHVRFCEGLGGRFPRATRLIVGFQDRTEAEQFLEELRERLGEFNLELHPDKTRLIEFGRFAAERRKRRGLGKPETFDFLGFTHSCSRNRKGRFTVRRQTMRKRTRAKLAEVKAELRRRWHDPVPEVGQWLGAVVRGHVRYYGVPGNIKAVQSFRYHVAWHWQRAMSRRSQKGHVTWERMERLIDRWLPPAVICHPYPDARLRVRT